MTIIVSGSETGLLNSSLAIVGRGDQVGAGNLGHGERLYVNAGNGNLMLQHQDAYLPSFGADFQLVRTYNQRGLPTDPAMDGKHWSLSTSIFLHTLHDGPEVYYEVQYGDGSIFEYRLDEATGLYVTTDGDDAFETIEDLGAMGNEEPAFLVTRADQSVMAFNKMGDLLSITDPNGVRMDFTYMSNRLQSIQDDSGHSINYVYEMGMLARIEDETGAVLVQYEYMGQKLIEVIDREGHSTKYGYSPRGELISIELPYEQVEDGQTVSYERREIQLSYEAINWQDSNSSLKANAGRTYAISQIVDAEGGITTFNYDFVFGAPMTVFTHPGQGNMNGNGNGNGNNGNGNMGMGQNIAGDVFYGGTTTITDAAGHMLVYEFDEDGYATRVTDQLGFATEYTYDGDNNLTSIADRNAWGITHSDSAHYRALRAGLGVTDMAGLGKLVGNLNQTEIDLLRAAYTATMTYDDRGNLLTTTDNDGFVTSYTYTAFNKIESTTSGNGHTTEFDYDANQNLIERRDPGGDITRYEYDAYGNRTRQIVFLDANDLTDPAKQQITQYFYDPFGNNVETVDPEGNHTFGEYDHFGNLTRYTDGNGNITTYTYDDDNRLLTVTDPLGHSTVNTYDPVGNRTSITDQNGHTVIRVYSQNNHLLAIIDPSETDPADDRATTFTYDVVGNRSTSTDAEGRVTTYNFNERRELVEVVTPFVDDETGASVQYTTEYSYDGESNRLSIRDRRGNLTELAYTQGGLLEQRTDALGNVTQYSYDANNNQIQIVVGAQLPVDRRQVVSLQYDEENQLVTHMDAQGRTRTYSYDAPGTIASITDERGNTTDYEYDLNNRLIREIAPEVEDDLNPGQMIRHVVERRYDANGNQVEIIDARGNSTFYTFDPDDRLVMVEDGNQVKTVYTYDSRNNRTSIQIGVEATAASDGQVTVTDIQNAQVTRYQYDEFNQLVAKTDGLGTALAESDLVLYQRLRGELLDPGSGDLVMVADIIDPDIIQGFRDDYTETYTYDRVGNLQSATDNEGRTTTNAYDALNRLVTRTDALVAPGHNSTETFRYDGNNNLVGMTDKLLRDSTFTYDALNRMTMSSDTRGMQTQFVYDEFGNLTDRTRAFGTGDARTTQYEYDLNNRLVKEIDPGLHETVTEYDPVGNRVKVTDGRNNATEFFYDALNRNIRILDPLTFETKFVYDGVGNMVRLTDARSGMQSFDFDAGNRQISLVDAEGRRTEFDYDVRGNRVEVRTGVGTGNADDLQVTIFEYDAENNLRSVMDAEGGLTTHDYDRVYNRTVTVDANGNETTMMFDALNRVVTIVDAEEGVTSFAYDAVDNVLTRTDALLRVMKFEYDLGDRLLKQFEDFGGADQRETHFTYDEVNNRLTMTEAANSTHAATTTFEYDLDDRLISERNAEGGLTTYAYDENHNLTAVTDANGHALVTSDDQIYRDMRVAMGYAELVADLFVSDTVADDVDELLEARTTHYEYDENNRVITITDPLDHTVEYEYDGNGNRVKVTDQRQFSRFTYFNANDEVTLSVDALGYATKFAYDANGNVIEQTLFWQALTDPLDVNVKPTPDASPLLDQTTTYSYDKLNRVDEQISGEGFRTQFVYDAVGNRLETRVSRDLANMDVAITRGYYDGLNRLIHARTAEGYLTSLDYDALGNLETRTVYDLRVVVPLPGFEPVPMAGDPGRVETFEYDRLNRQTAHVVALDTGPDVRTEFEYDARGNQTAQINAALSADAQRTVFQYDLADRLTDRINAELTVLHYELDAVGNVIIQTDGHNLPAAEQRVTRFAYDGNNRLTNQINALNVENRFAYDAAGNLTGQTFALGVTGVERTESFEYDGNGQMIASENGMISRTERTQFGYDAAGNRTLVTEAPGVATVERSTHFTYNRDNQLTIAIDAARTRTEFRYDGAGNQTEIHEAVGVTFGTPAVARITVSEYDLDNRLIKRTNPLGGETNLILDVLGRAISTSDENEHVTLRTFDNLGRLLTETTPEGIQLTQTYDLRGNIMQSVQAYTDGSDARVSTYLYDIMDRTTRVTDGEDFSTVFGYDLFGNQTSIEVGRYFGTVQAKIDVAFPIRDTFTYDKLDRMTSTTDGNLNVRVFQYDEVGNRTSSISWANGTASQQRVTEYDFDLANRVTEVRGAGGSIVRNTYDEVGNLTGRATLQSRDPNNVLPDVWINESFEYDGLGRQTLAVDGLLTQTRIVYDAVGNIIETHRAFGSTDVSVVKAEFDADGNRTADIDALDNRTEYRYDAAGNRITATDALGFTAHYYFDRNDRLISILDPEGYVNEFAYDSAGNNVMTKAYVTRYAGVIDDYVPPTPVVDPAFDRIVTTGYDKANNIVSLEQPDGTLSTYVNDSTGRLLTQTSFANTGAPRVETFQYDAGGRLREHIGVDGTVTTLYYDGANNKTVEELTNLEDPYNTVRRTEFTYDLANRQITQVFDPAGLNIIQRTEYDRVGNIVKKIDGNLHETYTRFDLNNRFVETTDALGNSTFYDYDLRGNVTSLTDPLGHVATFQYDLNDRLTHEISPEVQVYQHGFDDPLTDPVMANPTKVTVYDEVGNIVQLIDPNGNKTTRYYDGNGNMVAELTSASPGENVLRTLTYSGSGKVLSETLYMGFLGDAAHDPSLMPTGIGEERLTTYAYDIADRRLTATYPEVDVTTLDLTDPANPLPVITRISPVERNVYDVFGEEVENIDRNGNRQVFFYDVKGRLIASVDALGYLTEFTYDAQDNVIERVHYTAALVNADVQPGLQPPTPPAFGDVHRFTFIMDAAGRAVEELSPEVTNYTDPNTPVTERLRTRFTYDAVGNQLTRTLAYGTADTRTDYLYYDAADRQIALINGIGTVHLFELDANGNITLEKRFITPYLGDPSLLSGDGTNFATLVAGSDDDQATRRIYDALSRVKERIDLMAPGGADDLSELTRYDFNGNATWKKDADGLVSERIYNGQNLVIGSISPDGSGSTIVYDAMGNELRLFTGDVDNVILDPSLGAPQVNFLADTLTISWNTSGPGPEVTSWVVWSVNPNAVDPRVEPEDYDHQSPDQGTTTNPAASYTFSGVSPDDQVYYRIVSRDSWGNLSWTSEQRVLIPPRFEDLQVSRPAADQLTIKVHFDGNVFNPTLNYGVTPNTNLSASFTSLGGGDYSVTITSAEDLQSLNYQISWQDEDGNTFLSAAPLTEADTGHAGISTSVASSGSTLNATSRILASVVNQLADGAVEISWRLVGSPDPGFPFATSVAGVLTNDYYTFNFFSNHAFGTGTDLEVVISGRSASGQTVILDSFIYTTGDTSEFEGMSWALPTDGTAEIGSTQLVIINGQRDENDIATRRDGYLLLDLDDTISGPQDYDIFYGDLTGSSHNVTVTQFYVTTQIADVDPGDNHDPFTNPGGTDFDPDFDWRVDAYQMNVTATNIPGGVSARVAWRAAGSGSDFDNDVALGTNFDITSLFDGNGAVDFDLKIYYVDGNGNEVIVDWARVTTMDVGVPTGTIFTNADPLPSDKDEQLLAETSQSITVLASETAASSTQRADNVVTIDAGLYLGALDAEAYYLSYDLIRDPDPAPGGKRDFDDGVADGFFVEGYYVDNRYNEAGERIATNEGDGVWREFGLDANGNIVVTYKLGVEGATSSIDTFAKFDAKNQQIRTWGAPVEVHDMADFHRAIRDTEYDFAGNVIARTDPYVYGQVANVTRITLDGLSRKTVEFDVLNNPAFFRHDRLGNVIVEIDRNNHRTTRTFDGIDRMMSETNAENETTTYGLDAFNRRISATIPITAANPGIANRTSYYGYDQRDRVTSFTDRLDVGAQTARVTRFEYNGRDLRTLTIDPLGHTWENRYDDMGRVNLTITYQGGEEVMSFRSYDGFGNLINQRDADDGSILNEYGAFARLMKSVDTGDRVTMYTYDEFRNQIRQTNAISGKDIEREYDNAGRLTAIIDHATGVTTTFEYDIAGRIRSEITDAPGTASDRTLTYTYDALGQMMRWHDAVTGAHLNYQFDAAGNLKRSFTDPGYDAPGDLVGVDHRYTYDLADRIIEIKQVNPGPDPDTLIGAYTYDDAGNRITYQDEAGTVTSYTYYANGKVKQANSQVANAVDDTVQAVQLNWTYDDAGNILTFRNQLTFTNNATPAESFVEVKLKTKAYHENNRNYQTTDTTTKTVNGGTPSVTSTSTVITFSKAGNVLKEVTTNTDDEGEMQTFTYRHIYAPDGREIRIDATGDSTGSAVFTHDANDNIVFVDLGKGDDQDTNATKSFVFGNDGKILFRTIDDGIDGTAADETKYLYALSNPVGEINTAEDMDGDLVTTTQLDTGDYNLVQNIGSSNPSAAVTVVTAGAGDTLQTIASNVYGNPSLWFLIAEANGLSGNEELTAGQQILVPTTVQTGSLTRDTHVVYSESDIIGSTLPNLSAPPPDTGALCAAIIAIILTIIVAIVIAVVTFGIGTVIAAPITAAVTAGTISAVAGTVLTIAALAVVGGVLGFVGSLITQGILIGLTPQEDINWNQVAAGAVAGLISGAAAGIGAAVSAGLIVGRAAVNLASVAKVVLETGAEVVAQVISDEKLEVDSWTSIAGAFLSSAIGARIDALDNAAVVAAKGVKQSISNVSRGAGSAADKIAEIGAITRTADAAAQIGKNKVLFATVGQAAANIATGWVSLGELAAKDELGPENFIAVAANTLGVVANLGLGQKFSDVDSKFGQVVADGLFDVGFLGSTFGANASNIVVGLGALIAGGAGGSELGIRVGLIAGGGLDDTFFFPPDTSTPVAAVTQSPPPVLPPITFSLRSATADATDAAVANPGTAASSDVFAADDAAAAGGALSPVDAAQANGAQAPLTSAQGNGSLIDIATAQLGTGANGIDIASQAETVAALNPGVDSTRVPSGRSLVTAPLVAGIPTSTTAGSVISGNDARTGSLLTTGNLGSDRASGLVGAARQASNGGGRVATPTATVPGAGPGVAGQGDLPISQTDPLGLSDALISQAETSTTLADHVRTIESTRNGVRSNEVFGDTGAATQNNRTLGSLGVNGKLGVPAPQRTPGAPQTLALATPGVNGSLDANATVKATAAGDALALGAVSARAAAASLQFADGRSSAQQYAARLGDIAADNRVSTPSVAAAVSMQAAAAGTGFFAPASSVAGSAANLVVGIAAPWALAQFANGNAFQGFGSSYNNYAGAGGEV